MKRLYQLYEIDDFIDDKIEELFEVEEYDDEERSSDRYEQMAQRHHA
jgi:hypothetical protein|tara:strand:+ start:1468 stop:1608 length:141 start_codon:yes stop_codon:yes gene_type:complete